MNLKSNEIKLRNLGEQEASEWEQLIVSENMLSMIYNGSNAMMGLVTVDDDGDFTFVHANQKTLDSQRQNKVPDEVFFNNKLTTYLRDVGLQTKDEVKRVQGIYQKVVDSGLPTDFDTEVAFPNNTVRVINTALTPIIEGDTCTHIIFASSDVTEQRNVNKLQKESEENLRIFLESSSDAAALVSADFHIIDASSGMCKSLGKPIEQIVGVKMWDLLPPEVARRRKKMFEHVFETRKKVVFNDENHGKFFVNSINPILNNHGEIEKYAISANNITDKVLADTALKKAAQEARIKKDELYQASKMATLGTLVSGIAHEINNPNNNIMVNSSLLMKFTGDILPVLDKHYQKNPDFTVGGLDYPEFAGACHKLLESINSGAHRIKNTVNKLKNFSRKQSIAEQQMLNINEVISSAIDLITNQIKEATDNPSLVIDENLPPIKGHFSALEQVMVNLIENSCQALQDKSKYIKIECTKDQNEKNVLITVTDNGSGISGDIIDKIRDPFFTTRRARGGTGLGLSISASIIEDHQGSLEFKSIPGEKTEAIVTLPI